MGIKEAAIPLILFLVSICGIAQSAITVNAYLTTNKTKDSSYNFSMMILVVSVCLLFGSGYFAYKGFKGGAAVAAGAEAGAPAASATEAAALEEKLVGLNLPTLNALKTAIPNITKLNTVESARSAQSAVDSAVTEITGKLEQLKTSLNGRFAKKIEGLQTAKTAVQAAAALGE
jgi:hypothetical protein